MQMLSINGHLFKQTVDHCKQIIFFKAAKQISSQMVNYFSKRLLIVSE